MIRTKGEAGTGDVVNAVTHMRAVFGGIRRLGALREEELYRRRRAARAVRARQAGRRERQAPGQTFTAGGIATPADAALCMQLGADGGLVGLDLQVGRSRAPREGDRRGDDALPGRGHPRTRLRRLGEPMVGISTASLEPSESLKPAAGSPPLSLPATTRGGRRHLALPVALRSGAPNDGLKRPQRPRYDRGPRIGVLAVQGNFREHAAMLRSLGADVVEVRLPEQLDGLDGP